MPNLRIFGLEFENNIVMIQITILEFVLLQSFVQKKEIPKFGPKMPSLMPYLSTFWLIFCDQKGLVWGFLGWNLKTNCHILKPVS